MRLRSSPSNRSEHAHGAVAATQFADGIAARSLEMNPSKVLIDRSLAPPDGPTYVQLPACSPSCRHRADRPRAMTEATLQTFHELIPDEVLATLTPDERLALFAPQTEQRARRHVDVAMGPAVMVEPGLEDLARVRCPSALASILYALAPRAGCSCYAALVSAVPTDEPIGLLVHARAGARTARQAEDARIDLDRRREAAAGRSDYFRRLFEQRRRPLAGDLFSAFEIPLTR